MWFTTDAGPPQARRHCTFARQQYWLRVDRAVCKVWPTQSALAAFNHLVERRNGNDVNKYESRRNTVTS